LQTFVNAGVATRQRVRTYGATLARIPRRLDGKANGMPAAQSDKHGRRIDEQLEHDIAALTHGAPDEGHREWRREQAPADGEPDLALNRDVAGEVPGAETDERVLDLRAALAASLKPSDFPATGAELAASAREAFAPDEVVGLLEDLPGDRRYETMGEVWDDYRPGDS